MVEYALLLLNSTGQLPALVSGMLSAMLNTGLIVGGVVIPMPLVLVAALVLLVALVTRR